MQMQTTYETQCQNKGRLQANIDNANLSVISSVQCHPMLPEMLEEIW